MSIRLYGIEAPSLVYVCMGGFTVALYINEVVLGTGFGVLIGPHVAGIFDPRSWGPNLDAITLEFMRIVLATGLFAIGVELPSAYMRDRTRSLLIMVVPTMAIGWVIVAAMIYGLFSPLNYVSSLAIAACLTPTDPIICAAIVGGSFAVKNVPVNLRHILSAESAANDGLAYPFLSISIYLTLETSHRIAIQKWFLVGWLYEVVLGTVLGTILGFTFSRLMRYSQSKGFIDRQSYVAQFLALALFTAGVASSIGSDDLLAAFAAGCAIAWDGRFKDQIEDEMFSSVLDLTLNCACFVYIGAWMPFTTFHSPELGITPWRLVILFLGILFLRRIPPLLFLYKFIPEITSWREALFTGHFGPVGVGAVFVMTLAQKRLPIPHSIPHDQREVLAASIQPIVSFIVLCSIIIHGLSIPFFSLCRQVRTLSITTTLTSPTGNPADWLVWIRRAPAVQEDPGMPTEVDIEQGSPEEAAGDVKTRDKVGEVLPVNEHGGEVAVGVLVDLHEEGERALSTSKTPMMAGGVSPVRIRSGYT